MKLLEQAEAEQQTFQRPESCERVEKSDDLSLAYYGSEIKTVDELLKSSRVDLRLWEVVEQRINNWEVAGKKKNGQDEHKRMLPDTLWKTGLRQITVKLRRRAPKGIQDSILDLLSGLKPLPASKPPKRETGEPHMMEAGVYDHHFGKLCWGEETGTNYDLKIADDIFRRAIDGMLARSKGFAVEKILMPVGNDAFHIDDWIGQTANGTRVESVDDRFSKVFRRAYAAYEYAIRRALQMADVDLFWVPGNHDKHTSWYLVEILAAMFRNEPRVTIDNGPKERKYRAYGPSLIGYVHGDELPPKELALLMPVEEPDLWAASTFRSWRLGHWHKRKEVRHTVGDTFNGVEVRIMPSMSGTDAWHYKKGFTGNARMAECHLWSKTAGPVGYFLVNEA